MSSSVTLAGDDATDRQRLAELNAYWKEVSRCVTEGDFEGYSATCHPSGVLVSSIRGTTQPLTEALSRWKQGFADTRADRIEASVEFRFSKRLNDLTTAHETGIFRYVTIKPGNGTNIEFIQFEGLLLKVNGEWKIVMEHQKSRVTSEAWNALKPTSSQPRNVKGETENE